MLERLVRGPAAIRRWAARKAADRALHWTALRGAAEDPYILARLGLYRLALRGEASDEKARVARAIAALATGQGGGVDEIIPPSLWTMAARAIAPMNPASARDLLSADQVEARAACAIALGEESEAVALLRTSQSREAHAIRAHCAVAAGHHDEARRVLNALFEADDLAPPLGSGEAPFSIDDLHSEPGETVEGPKVSVIIPYRDAADTLETAVGSMLAQSWRNLEILLVDDRSADESPSIAARLAEQDDRIVALSNRRAPGVYGARNTAVEAASGDFVTFLDADDWSPAERIARQVSALQSHGISIANHIRMDETGRPVAPRVFPLVRPVPITMLTRTEIFRAAGPFEEVATGADSEMFARLEMLHGKRAVARDPAVLLVARWRSGSLSEAAEGGMLGAEREAYRAQWMFRHAGVAPPRLPASASGE